MAERSVTDPNYLKRGDALGTPRGKVRHPSHPLPPPQRTGVESVDSRAGLGSNPVTPATLDRLLTFSSTFLCLGFPLYEERMSQSPFRRAGVRTGDPAGAGHPAPRAGSVSEEEAEAQEEAITCQDGPSW